MIPATDRYGDLKKIKQRTLVVNGKNDMQWCPPSIPASFSSIYRMPG